MAFPISSSLLDAIVLAIISQEGDEGTYGYKITQDMRQVADVSESTLYPVLRRLLKSGYLTTYDRAFAGRNRRYYRLTPTGRMQYAVFMADWAKYRDSIEKVFFGGSKV